MSKKITFITSGGKNMIDTIRDKDELIENLSNLFESFKSYKQKERKTVETKIKNGLKQYKILPGDVQELINDPSRLNEAGIDKVYLLAEQTYEVLKKSNVNPESYFTKREIKEIKTTFEGYGIDKVDFPYEFKDVIRINDDDYITSIKASEIKFLFENALLQYNTETQREARQITKGDQIIEVPKIYEKSVKEMEELMEKGEIISSVITFNARLGSSDSDTEEELEYDENTKTLTVTKGTLLDVLDGFHRINAVVRALRKNPSIDTTFKLNILNFDKKRAREYFAQMNTISAPINKGHLNTMRESKHTTFIANYVQANSELRGKIYNGSNIPYTSPFLTTSNTLWNSIEDNFKVSNKKEAIEVAQYLTEFINTLFMYFPEEFLGNNIQEIRNRSLISANVIFYGYVLLCKRLYQEGISLSKLKDIISDIDFSRNNPMWINKKLINKEGQITAGNAKNIVYKIFKELNLEKYK